MAYVHNLLFFPSSGEKQDMAETKFNGGLEIVYTKPTLPRQWTGLLELT